MKVLGITGGVGSGKSEILKILHEDYGAYVCQMDETARELQKKGTECFDKIVRSFGDGIIASDGELDRRALGSIVFADRSRLEQLNAIVHPEVLRVLRNDLRVQEAAGTGLYVIESALLTRVGKELCDEIWYIYTDPEVRRVRLTASRGYTGEQIMAMTASQPDEDEFRRNCTAVIDNSGSPEETKRQIGETLRL